MHLQAIMNYCVVLLLMIYFPNSEHISSYTIILSFISDYYALLMGLAIGIPVFFLFLGIGLLLSVYCKYQRHTQKRSKDKDQDLDRYCIICINVNIFVPRNTYAILLLVT